MTKCRKKELKESDLNTISGGADDKSFSDRIKEDGDAIKNIFDGIGTIVGNHPVLTGTAGTLGTGKLLHGRLKKKNNPAAKTDKSPEIGVQTDSQAANQADMGVHAGNSDHSEAGSEAGENSLRYNSGTEDDLTKAVYNKNGSSGSDSSDILSKVEDMNDATDGANAVSFASKANAAEGGAKGVFEKVAESTEDL